MAIVPPVRVRTPNGPTFRFWSVFWTAEAKKPTPPVIRVVWIAAPMASFGWNGLDSSVPAIVEEGLKRGTASKGDGSGLAVVRTRLVGGFAVGFVRLWRGGCGLA